MELDTLVGYLVALVLPLWLLVELLTHPWRSEQPAKPLESDCLPGSPVPRAPSTAPRARARRKLERPGRAA
jgi:hypothetical protein